MKTRLEPELIIRTAKKKDLNQVIHVAIRALTGGEDGLEDLFRRYFTQNPHLPPERLYVAEKDGAIVGTTAILDFQFVLDGKLCPADGLAAVTVDPIARRQGVADELVRESIRFSQRRRAPFSALYPFRGSFYRRFGYAPVEISEAIRTPSSTLPDSPERQHVRYFRADDRPGIERAYKRMYAGRTGLLERSKAWWDWRVLEGKREVVVYARGKKGSIEGYLINDMPDPGMLGERRYRVLEWVANTPRANRGLMAWLASQGDEASTIEIYRSRDESVVPFLRNWAGATPPLSLHRVAHTGYLGWGMMIRITDLERALAFRPGRGVRGSVAVELTDKDVPENEEPVTVQFGPRGAKTKRGIHSKSRLKAPVSVFSQIWFGAMRASHARAMGEIECSKETAEMLDRAWLGPAPFLGTLNGF